MGARPPLSSSGPLRQNLDRSRVFAEKSRENDGEMAGTEAERAHRGVPQESEESAADIDVAVEEGAQTQYRCAAVAAYVAGPFDAGRDSADYACAEGMSPASEASA